MTRTSVVNQTRVINVSLSSVFQIGDSEQIVSRSKALAVQRQLQLFYGNEGDFQKYPAYTLPISRPPLQTTFPVHRYNRSPFIKVNMVNITSVAASSVYHIGSTNYIDAETRIKHIRQIEKLPEDN